MKRTGVSPAPTRSIFTIQRLVSATHALARSRRTHSLVDCLRSVSGRKSRFESPSESEPLSEQLSVACNQGIGPAERERIVQESPPDSDENLEGDRQWMGPGNGLRRYHAPKPPRRGTRYEEKSWSPTSSATRPRNCPRTR